MEKIVNTLRSTFNSNVTKSKAWRVQQLNALARLIDENHNELASALKKDLNKHEHEVVTMEFGLIKNSITHALNNLDNWMKPVKTAPIIQARPVYSTYIDYQPLGVVFIIGAWNYPYQLTLVPLVGAIAAGNCALVKPSELSVNSAELLEKLWPKYFDSKQIALVNGGIPETTELLKQRYDYIFYTGNTVVGKIVMKAAAEHMTPTTLECGGKSPIYIDSTADLNVTAKRLLWGRLVNSGQTCVAPDYVLTTKEIQEALLPLMKKTLADFYGDDPKNSESFGRIVNARHFKRISGLIDKSKVVIGGDVDEKTNYISPTVMFNVTANDKVMQEEIFGPVLPFITVKNMDEAIDFINKGEKPLALYVFSKDEKVQQAFRDRTSSGGMGLNETLMQCGFECIPFGGVGASGVGQYHGKHSFETFSHQRAILKSSFFTDALTFFRYPPYTKSKTSNAVMGSTEMRDNIITKTIFNTYVLVALTAALAYFFTK